MGAQPGVPSPSTHPILPHCQASMPAHRGSTHPATVRVPGRPARWGVPGTWPEWLSGSLRVRVLPAQKPLCLHRRGLILQDLTFVHLGNPDHIDGKVNFSKRWQQFNILDSMRCFQQA